MSTVDISIIIDYSILLFHKFSTFIVKNNFRTDQNFENNVKNHAFIVQKHSVAKIRKTLHTFNPVSYHLSYEEKKLVLLLLGASLYGQNGINIWQAMCFFHRLPFYSMKSIGNILDPKSGLLKSGMMMFQETDFLGTSLSIEEIADFYNNRKVFLSPFALNSLFSSFTGKNLYGISSYAISDKYKNIDVLLNDISNVMKYIFFLSNFYKVNYSYSSVKDDIYEKGDFSHTLKQLKKNIIKSGLKIGLVDFVKINNFTNIEFIVLLYFIYKVVIVKEFIINNVEEILTRLAFIPSQIKRILSALSKESIFVKENYIEPADYYNNLPFEEDDEEEAEGGFSNEQSEYDFLGIPPDYNPISIVKEKIYNLVFTDNKDDKKIPNKKETTETSPELTNRNTVDNQKNKGLFEIVIPNVTINNVILDDDVKRELMGAVDLTRAIDTMKKWGIKPNLASNSFGSIKVLLYGASGTGKTITAQALAGEVGAELFKVDASNLVSSWVGESTKNVKRSFREFYKYANASKKRVFLFMNEADQLLSSRGTIMQAADKEYNQMQNLLLEELENFDGVFIATTNLVDLFDTAWNRRFNIKIKFDIPRYETRLKLWKVHISDQMPLAGNVDFNKLAEYELAGGSIANIVYNAARKAALRDSEPREVTQQDFIDSIQNELKSHLGVKSSRVGFSQ